MNVQSSDFSKNLNSIYLIKVSFATAYGKKDNSYVHSINWERLTKTKSDYTIKKIVKTTNLITPNTSIGVKSPDQQVGKRNILFCFL